MTEDTPPLFRRAARRARRELRRASVTARDLLPSRRRDIRAAAPETFVRSAYQTVLRREGDEPGIENYVQHLRRGTLDADGVVDEMTTSMEFRAIPHGNLMRSAHLWRCDFVRELPRARRILDLGGTDQNDPAGALVTMGYPYRFEELTIVELPPDDRHELYRGGGGTGRVDTPLGPVTYRHHSMVDLSGIADSSYDLVVSGQSIEHVTEDDADVMLRGAYRVLRSGGYLAVDTPNGRAARLQSPDQLLNPDHEIEYTHEELAKKMEAVGFEIVEAKGLGYLGESFASGVFSEADLLGHPGVYADIRDCYFLAYLCRKPS